MKLTRFPVGHINHNKHIFMIAVQGLNANCPLPTIQFELFEVRQYSSSRTDVLENIFSCSLTDGMFLIRRSVFVLSVFISENMCMHG